MLDPSEDPPSWEVGSALNIVGKVFGTRDTGITISVSSSISSTVLPCMTPLNLSALFRKTSK
jgi:hypothetical protein